MILKISYASSSHIIVLVLSYQMNDRESVKYLKEFDYLTNKPTAISRPGGVMYLPFA